MLLVVCWIILWIILFFAPRWGLLHAFTLCVGFASIGFSVYRLHPLLDVVVFLGIGALIVAMRIDARIEREIDDTLAQMRARSPEITTPAQSNTAPTSPPIGTTSAHAERDTKPHLASSVGSLLRRAPGPLRLWIVASLSIWGFGIARFIHEEGNALWLDSLYLMDQYWPYWIAPFALGALMIGIAWVRAGYRKD